MKLLTLTLLFILSSCATTTPGLVKSTENQPISHGLTYKVDLSSDGIYHYIVSFKNNTDEWVDVESVEVVDANKDLEVILGNRMASWYEAISLEKEVKATNEANFLASLALASAVVAVSTQGRGDTGLVAIGVLRGSLDAFQITQIMALKQNHALLNILPDGHILRPFSVPPRKAMQRWVLAKSKTNTFNAKVTLKSESGKTYEINI